MATQLVVALTGGIGSGKTTVAGMFEQKGAGVVDTDEISHALTRPGGRAIAPIAAAFGGRYIAASGALDREAMRVLVFAEPASKAQLESILHPMIREGVDEALATLPPSCRYAILVVPLLFESAAYRRRAQRTLTVDCPTRLQIARVQQRSGLAPVEIHRIMASQVSRACRLQMADDVICNSVDQITLDQQISRLHARYTGTVTIDV
jgi:dephospho-CoA kinase